MATIRSRGDGQRLFFSVYVSATAHTLVMVGIALASLRLPTCATPAPCVPPKPIDISYLGVLEKEKEEPLELPEAKVVDEHHQAPEKKKKEVARVLAALQNLKPRSPNNLKTLVSNIAAVRVPGGTRFRVSGVISKIIPSGTSEQLRRARQLLEQAREACGCTSTFGFSLRVRADGTVKEVTVWGNVPRVEERCVESRAMRWKLPSSSREVYVEVKR
jgi:hypothetical protein